jgi:hypothetical protein
MVAKVHRKPGLPGLRFVRVPISGSPGSVRPLPVKALRPAKARKRRHRGRRQML